jgi:hypothetical protein
MERKARRTGHPCDTRDALYLGLEVPRAFVLRTMMRGGAAEPVALAYYGEYAGG